MAFSLFFSITVILIVSFVVTKRNLHVYEILFIWMVTIVVDHNLFTITALNLDMLYVSKHPANYWSLSLVRIFLVPLLVTWYFDETFSSKPYKKWGWLPVGILLLYGVDYVSERLSLYRPSRFHLWSSLFEWLVLFIIVNYAWVWYRRILNKEMKTNKNGKMDSTGLSPTGRV